MITSTQNPRVKFVRTLRKSSVRKKMMQFLVEGEREVERALLQGYELLEIFFVGELPKSFDSLIASDSKQPVSQEVFEKLVVRATGVNCIGIFRYRSQSLKNVITSENPCLIAVEGVEKPGNLGAVVRTADAIGADAVLVIDAMIDIYNPNVIRASLGTIFSVPTFSLGFDDVIELIRSLGLKVVSTWPLAEKRYADVDFKGPLLMAFGAEDTGLGDRWRSISDNCVAIPMRGLADSLNLSVAMGVVAFEAIRQRING